MIFTVLLYVSLGIFSIGLIYKVSTWFTRKIGISADDIAVSTRVFTAVKGTLGVVFSPKILTLLKVFILDVLFQRKIFEVDLLRWVMHMLIFYGFMLLLLMHALDSFISESLFSNYYSTLNPFMFIRDLSALLVIAGIAIAMYRRFILKIPRLKTSAMDHYAIMIVAVIMISGIFLEGTKIMSHTAFQDMVDEYGDLDDEEEMLALESFWIADFGVVSPNVKAPFDRDVLAQGKELHEMTCVDCHSSPKWAFTGYATAKILSPVALALDRIGSTEILWYIHIIACFLGLAYLPFSKMFHIIASPISLLTNAVMDSEKSDPANIATRQIMELDACTHCGTCTTYCSVGVTFELFQNINILPSEKIASVKALAAGKKLSGQEIKKIQEGLYLCTNCHRCTDVCPVGINLQELWFNVREKLLRKGYPEFLTLSLLSFYRGLRKDVLAQEQYEKPVNSTWKALEDDFKPVDVPGSLDSPTQTGVLAKRSLTTSAQGDTFSHCFTCTTCSTVCPVANNYENDLNILGMVPHQIMHAAILGIPDPIFRSNMLWSCLGCYECQQHCPQGVRVTDVFYELKNLAIEHAKKTSP
ncbi:MAG: 4Fe-4S dicluster domain-containing protein [Deltaproteobacteria bacterium]|nr:4Fe-4S dicluster domain-containing protein [Deltaproteobacteria bacterium]